MKLECILFALLVMVQVSLSDEMVFDDKTKIIADKITETETAEGIVIVAEGNAIVVQKSGGFSGVSFASIETPILLNVKANSISCSGWFYATNGKETYGFGEMMAHENTMVFTDDGKKTASVIGAVLIPGIPNQQKVIDEHRALIEGAKTLIEKHTGIERSKRSAR